MADPNITKYAVKVLPVSFYSLFSIYYVGIKVGFFDTFKPEINTFPMDSEYFRQIYEQLSSSHSKLYLAFFYSEIFLGFSC